MVRPVAITTGRHPHELAFIVTAIVIGGLLIITGYHPRSTETMPPLLQQVWPTALLIGGSVSLVGVSWRALERSLFIEMLGMILLGGTLTLYTLALIRYSGAAAATSGGFAFAFGAGSWWRAVQIQRDLKRLDNIRARVQSLIETTVTTATDDQ